MLQPELMQVEQKWIDIFTSIAKTGAMSYFELKRLDAYEFFHIYHNHIEELKRKGNKYGNHI